MEYRAVEIEVSLRNLEGRIEGQIKDLDFSRAEHSYLICVLRIDSKGNRTLNIECQVGEKFNCCGIGTEASRNQEKC